MGCVYIVTNMANGKQYVGKTIMKAENRLYEHFKYAKRGVKSIFGIAIRKYGEQNFSVETLYESDDEELLYEIEIDFVWLFNTFKPNGYNMTHGGDGKGFLNLRSMNGKHHTEMSKQKIRQANLGKRHTDKTKEKMSLAHKGKIHKLSEKGRLSMSEKISEANSRRIWSEESRSKLSLSLRIRSCKRLIAEYSENPMGMDIGRIKAELKELEELRRMYGKTS